MTRTIVRIHGFSGLPFTKVGLLGLRKMSHLHDLLLKEIRCDIRLNLDHRASPMYWLPSVVRLVRLQIRSLASASRRTILKYRTTRPDSRYSTDFESLVSAQRLPSDIQSQSWQKHLSTRLVFLVSPLPTPTLHLTHGARALRISEARRGKEYLSRGKMTIFSLCPQTR